MARWLRSITVISHLIHQISGTIDLSTYHQKPEDIEHICSERSNSLCNFWWNVAPERFWKLNADVKKDFISTNDMRMISAWRTNSRIVSSDETNRVSKPNLSKLNQLPQCPTLPDDYLGDWSDFAAITNLGDGNRCFLPSSRSYLLSFFSSVIRPNPEDLLLLSSGKLKPGDVAILRFELCQVKSIPNHFWRDIWSRFIPQNKDLDIYDFCSHLNMWGRLIENRKDTPKQGAQSIWNIMITSIGNCQWKAYVKLPQSTWHNTINGSFSLEILNVWQSGLYGAGSHDYAGQKILMERLNCSVTPGFAWRGQTLKTLWDATYFAPDVLSRGGNYMDCCDRCMLHQQCKAWTHWEGNGQQNCWFFKKLPPASPPDTPNDGLPPLSHLELAQGPHNHLNNNNETKLSLSLERMFGTHKVFSGVRRRDEFLTPHLGGRNMGSLKCTKHAHILGSPFPISYDLRKSFLTSLTSENRLNNNQVSSTSSSSPKPTSPTIPHKDCGRSLVGQVRGHWQRFDAQICMNALNTILSKGKNRETALSDVLRKNPICSLLQLEDSPKISSGHGPKEYDTEFGMNDLSWHLNDFNCRVNHYNDRAAKSCFTKLNISNVVFSGDSVIGAFSQAFKVMLGASGASKGTSWYSEESDRVGSSTEENQKENLEDDVSKANAMLDAGASRVTKKDYTVAVSGILGQKHTIHFNNANVKSSQLDIDPIATGRNFVDELNLGDKKGSTTVVVLNFGIHHLLWRHSLSWIEHASKGFAYGLKQRLGSLAAHRVINFSPNQLQPIEFIYLTPSAVHGFREPYVTLKRSQDISAIMKKVLAGAGFRVLDAFSTEWTRPEMSMDGLHYNDAANYMHVQLLLNMLCNNEP